MLFRLIYRACGMSFLLRYSFQVGLQGFRESRY